MIGDHILQKLYFGSIFELAFDAIVKAILGDLHYQVVNIRRMLDEFALIFTFRNRWLWPWMKAPSSIRSVRVIHRYKGC